MEKTARTEVGRNENEGILGSGVRALVGESTEQIMGGGFWTSWVILTRQGFFWKHLDLSKCFLRGGITQFNFYLEAECGLHGLGEAERLEQSGQGSRVSKSLIK